MISASRPVGFCLVLSAPSGTGKTTIAQALLESDPHVKRSISMTTRASRTGEVDGEDYIFTTQSSFRTMVEEGGFLEWAQVHSDYYGTPSAPVKDTINSGGISLLVIDVQGGQSVKAIFPDAVLVFLVPPSMESLERRLNARGTDDESVIRKRLSQAETELGYLAEYTYGVVNEDDQQEKTVAKIQSIIAAEHCRVNRWET
ncbi:MAG: guanylate kinase [Candidatus Latescibacteria bacterium]|jgi:guanylate kinase|nr:guanylate kinase [Candidatus Latescibacterota bacterium]